MYMLNGYVESNNHNNYTLSGNDILTASSGGYKIYTLNNGNSYLTGNGATTLNIPAKVTTSSGYREITATVQTLTNAQANLIEEVTWHLGGTDIDNNSNLTGDFYDYERGTEVCTTNNSCVLDSSRNRPVTWRGKIGLIYPSDFGYATSGGSTTNKTTCLNMELDYWINWETGMAIDCTINDWLLYTESSTSNNGTATAQWTICSDSSYSNEINVIVAGDDNIALVSRSSVSIGSAVLELDGVEYEEIVDSGLAVRPSFYLKPTVSIKSGSGSYTDPYIFE